jgi:hypothetical protein
VSTPRRRRSSHPAIIGAVIAAVATVVAAAIPVALELVRDTGGGGAVPQAQGSPSVVPSQVVGPQTTAGPGSSAAPTSGAPSITAPVEAEVRSLVEMPEVDDWEGWQQEPRTVAGRRHETVLTASPCWLNDHYTATFVVSRQYRFLEAAVGIADDSPVALPLRFTVLVDRKKVFTTTVGLGKTRPVKVDISAATQVSLQVSTTSVDQCHGDSIGTWIAPRLRR